jgi:murein DD-endopeptidase MepM/ murein hydrolase activator NlpD
VASNQPAYAPPAPEAESAGAGGWDEFPASETPDAAAAAAAAYLDDLRGRHRLPRQRNLARGTTVLGVAAMAAVGAGGVAVAAESAPAPLAAPDLSDVSESPGPDVLDVPDAVGVPESPGVPNSVALSAVKELPGVATPADDTSVHGAADGQDAAQDRTDPAPDSDPAATTDTPAGVPTAVEPGEALRTRILGQVARQREAVARAEREAAEKAAADQAAREAAAQKVREQAAQAKAAAEEKAKAEAAAAAKAEAERLAQLAASYVKPVASYTLTAGFGESDSPWATSHTGQDFDAPTGTPAHAVHGGTVTSAGWAGSYGYRVVLTLDDGTELWYCHLSTMVVTSGQVTTGDTIGRVGATGNVPSPHLHLEVRPGGGAPTDPLPWLRSHDVTV